MRIVIDVKDSKAAVFLRFIRTLDFVTVHKTESSAGGDVKKALEKGLSEVKEMESGKRAKKPLSDLMDEL
jgi:hypothetical protein